MPDIRVLYYRAHLRREESFVKRFLWSAFNVFKSPCRMLIEVFIRRDFGERYFRISSAIGTFLFFWYLPNVWYYAKFLLKPLTMAAAAASGHTAMQKPPDDTAAAEAAAALVLSYAGWYLYLLAFLGVCIYHYIAQRRTPGVFDFERHSLDSGTRHRFFTDFKFKGQTLTVRTVECWLEPAPFFLAGIVLAAFGQTLGWLLMFSAAVYAVSYVEAYKDGDNHVMDIIDDMIKNKQDAQSFMDELSRVKIPGTFVRLPNDPAKRQAVLDRMQGDADAIPIAD